MPLCEAGVKRFMNKHKRYIPQPKKRHSKRRPQPHLPAVVEPVATVTAVQFEEARLVPYDENLLERSRTQWQFGDWESLAQLSRDTLQHHPDRAKLALLAASGLLQQGEADRARQFVRLAQDWGCNKKLVSQILVAGVHNTLARAAAVGGQEQRALGHFTSAITTGMPGSDSALISTARAAHQVQQLGFSALANTASSTTPSISQQFDAFKREVQTTLAPAKTNPYGHNRTLTSELNKALRAFFSSKLGMENLKPSYMDYLALKAIEIEKQCVGRLATTIQDAVVRQVVAESVAAQNLCILEIGSLYGVNLAILYSDCVTRFESVKIIGLDPFEGFYGNAVDAILNTPINPQVFLRNMQICNIPPEHYRMIRQYSTDPAALLELAGERINLLIIDGDHTYDGVKFDFETYAPLLAAGGYVIFDDYNAKEWPGVQQYVDELIRNLPHDFSYIGAFSRTALFMKHE